MAALGTTMIADLKFAIRTLLRDRIFTVGAAAMLALGIGATTTMFSATNAILLKPLPYPDPDRLFVVRETRAQAQFAETVMSAREYLEWTRESHVVNDATLVSYPGVAITLDGAPERVPALQVSADFFRLFGVRPTVGRPFTRDAEQPGAGNVLLIAHRVWQERFGGVSNIVGRTVRLEGRPATIIGVLPPQFSWSGRVDLVVPMTFSRDVIEDAGHSFDVYARLAPDVTRQQAIAELSRVALANPGPTTHATGIALVPLRKEIAAGTETPILIMFGAVGFVLLIACANIANLLLARGASRQREMAIRLALGAGRGRVVRQLLTESVLLSLLGGVGGALLATWLTELLVKGAGASLPRADAIGVDGRSLLFSLVAAVAAGILFGVVPAWQASRSAVATALAEEGRGATRGRRRALSAFAIAEVALAMVLLVGATLLLATFAHLRRVDPGFDPDNALVVPAFLPAWKYETADAQRMFFERVTTALAAVPGVTAVGATNAVPLSGDNTSGSLTIEGRAAPTPATRPNADRRSVTPGYFAAMGIRLWAGRFFTSADNAPAPRVVIVSRGFAEHYWPGEDALGKRLKLARFEADAPWRTVVGIVNDVQHASLSDHPRPVIYYPHAQDPSGEMQLIVRTTASNAAVAPSLRSAIAQIDRDLPVNEVRPLSAYVRDALTDTAVALSLLGSFAAIALVLASAGIYGVMAFAVAERRREFGIRVALGAAPRDLARLIASHALRLTTTGIVLGVGGARLTASLLRGFLAGVQPADPRVFATTAAVLMVVALAACAVPAVRAIRVDPNEMLRTL